jgi:hypothetical protein
MSPSGEQLANLSLMKSLLSANRRAQMLATSLWEFFRFRLYCTIHADDGQPSSHHIDLPTENEPLQIRISLRQTHRQEEALVHELLHANLIPLGYPTFRIWARSDRKWRLAGGIINLADHVSMLPIFLSFGYSADRFLGPGKPETCEERRINAKIEALAPHLKTPQGYLAKVATCLRDEKISVKPVYLATGAIQAAPEVR